MVEADNSVSTYTSISNLLSEVGVSFDGRVSNNDEFNSIFKELFIQGLSVYDNISVVIDKGYYVNSVFTDTITVTLYNSVKKVVKTYSSSSFNRDSLWFDQDSLTTSSIAFLIDWSKVKDGETVFSVSLISQVSNIDNWIVFKYQLALDQISLDAQHVQEATIADTAKNLTADSSDWTTINNSISAAIS